MPDKEKLKQIEEEAMAEWLERGYDIKDFSLEKMQELWREEDEDGDDEEALQDKQELIQNLNLLDTMKEQAADMSKQFKETIKEEAKNALKTAWKYAEILPLRNRRLLREHVVDVKQMDADSMKYFYVRQIFKEEFMELKRQNEDSAIGLKKRNKRKAPLLFRTKQNKQDAIQAEQDQILQEIELKRRECIDREIAEKAQRRAEKEKFLEDNRIYRRKMNMHYWKDRYIQAKQYSLALNEEIEKHKTDEFNLQVELMKAEIREMQGEEAADHGKDFDRNEMTSSLGIYDTNFEPGEWNSAIDGEDQPELDDQTISFSITRSYKAEHELKRIELQEAQSKILSLREKLDQIVQVKQNLTLDRTTINERKDFVSLEIKQVNQQHSELAEQIAGPPRRDPFEEEKVQFHMLVQKKAFFVDQMTELNQREQNIQKRMQIANETEKKLQPLLKKAQEIEVILKKEVDAFEKESIELPMIVGRGLQTNQITSSSLSTQDETNDTLSNVKSRDSREIMAISKPLPNPRKLMAQVERRSKFELFKAAALPVNEHFRKARNYNVDTWKLSHERQMGEEELERARNRLADLRENFFEQKSKDIRADLVQAIQKFHQGNQKLRKSVIPEKGLIEWWKYRNPIKTQGILYNENIDGLQLTPTLSEGSIRGSFRFPKHCSYRIQIDIICSFEFDQKDNDLLDANGDQNQSIRIYIGNDFDCLQKVHLCNLNGKIPMTEQVFAEVYGSRLCYHFDFSCSPKLVKMRHEQTQEQQSLAHDQCILMLANVGKYEERIQDFREEEQNMRLLQKEDHFLSEMVKTMRVQSKFSNQRCAFLLEELIQVEQSKAHTWDSKFFHGYEQRFVRTTYLGILKEEIKKEIAAQIDEEVLQRQNERRGSLTFSRYRRPSSVDKSYMDPTTVFNGSEGAFTSPLRLQQSKSEYQARKFETVAPLIIKASESLGEYCSFKQQSFPDLGSVNEQGTEMEDLDEQISDVAMSNPRDDKVETAQQRAKRRRSMLASKNFSQQKLALIVGLRFEWREGKTKLRVLHRIHSTSTRPNPNQSLSVGKENTTTPNDYHEQWCSLEEVNAIFISNDCVHALKDRRDLLHKSKEQFKYKESKLKALEEKKLEMKEEEEFSNLVAQKEDEFLCKQKQKELESRKKFFQAEAMRVATYNEQIASQLEFQAKRRAKNKCLRDLQLDSDGAKCSNDEASDEIPKEEFQKALEQVKQEFVQQFVEGRLALVNKTWERKERRVQEKRENDRKGRRLRLLNAKLELLTEIGQNGENLAKVKQDQEELIQKQSQLARTGNTKLKIPNFHLALPPKAPCEHLEVKAWGDKYGKGYKCRECGKEMSTSDEDLTQTKGSNPQLDDDIQADRLGMLCFKNAEHFTLVEKERIRLEKEARLLELQEIYMYDHQLPKVIEKFNYRHFLNRSKNGSDQFYEKVNSLNFFSNFSEIQFEMNHPRARQDFHEANYREEMLFFGRIKNFRFRIFQLAQKHAQLMIFLSVEKNFLKKYQQEYENILNRIPMVEIDHAISSKLIEKDHHAQKKLDLARKELKLALKERRNALIAAKGVEEEAEFAELHAPALKKSYQNMNHVYNQMKQRKIFLMEQIKESIEKLDELYTEQENNLTLRRSKLFFYDQSQLTDQQKKNMILQHPQFGLCRFLFIRQEDEMIVLEPLQWKARFFLPFETIIFFEKAKEQAEKQMMSFEERQGKFFYQFEKFREKKEIEQMYIEDLEINSIMTWRQQKEKEEKQIQNIICQQEFQVQIDLELHKKQIHQKAIEEAKQLHFFSRVSLKKKKNKIKKKQTKKHPIFQKQKQKQNNQFQSLKTDPKIDPKTNLKEEIKALDITNTTNTTNTTEEQSKSHIKSFSIGKFDQMRITKAAQKRLMMFQVEQNLLGNEKNLRVKFFKQRNKKYVKDLTLKIYHGFIQDLLTNDIVQETLQANVQASIDFQWNNMVSFEEVKQMDKILALERLYLFQMKKYTHLFQVWSPKQAKMEIIRKELTKRHFIAEIFFQEQHIREKRRHEMLLEEKQMRFFMRHEMITMIRERKQMQKEENETKEFLRQIEIQKMQVKYAKMIQAKTKKTVMAERRYEIKKAKMDKHRFKREWMEMTQEDTFSMMLRQEFLSQQNQLHNQIEMENFVALKKFMENLDAENDIEEKNENLKFQKKLLKFQKQKQKENHLFSKFQFEINFFTENAKNRSSFFYILQKYIKYQQELTILNVNVIKMQKPFDKIQLETEKVVEDAFFKRQKAIACLQRVEKAEKNLKEKIWQEKIILAERKGVFAQTCTMDSSVLHDRPQRFKTEYLHSQLYAKYFDLIIEKIISMAIVQAQEKQIAKLEKEIETIDKEKQQQIQLFEKIGRKHTRSSRLRLKRSQLGQLIFGKTQKRKLKTFLTQWIQFYSQRIIVRANFQLRQETIRQNQRVIQLEKDDAFSKASLLVDSTREEMTKLTILHTQQQKKIQCRLCKSIYTQAQNHRLACAYHPGAYEVACVRSCRTRQGGPIEATCMLHRAKRWLCCDATEEGRYGQNGCKQRFHLAIHEDPVLEKIVAKKQQEDDEEKNRYQQKIDEIDTRNLMGQKHQQIKAVVNDIEKELGEKRKLVALYEKITSRK